MKPKIVTYPELEKNVVHHYAKYQKDDMKYWVKCSDVLRNEQGVLCYCNMEEKREDRYKKWLLKHVHVCHPGEPVNQKTIDEMINNKDEHPIPKFSQEAIYEQMAIFTGKYNLSLDVLSSPDFYNLAINLIALGLTNSNKVIYEPLEEAKSLLKPIKRDKLRYVLVNTAFKKHRQIMANFKKQKYVCLALDEGKTEGYQNLYFVLECPNSDLVSYPCDTIRMNGGKAIHYVESIMAGFQSIIISDIPIGTVVCDGNLAQKKAFSINWKKSLRFKDIPKIKDIIYIPCLCHKIQNAYKNLVKNNKDMNLIIAQLHEISKICRNKASEIGGICPSPCETRWIYDFDIVTFILNNLQKIQKITSQMTPRVTIPVDEFRKLKKALIIFKCLVSTFENPKTQFQTAFIHLERGFLALLEIGRDDDNQYAKSMAYALQSYTLHSIDGGIWSLAYCFTPFGRQDIHNRTKKSIVPLASGYNKYFNSEKQPDNDDIDQVLDISIEMSALFLDPIMMTTDGKENTGEETDSEFNPENLGEEEEEEEEEIIDIESDENFKSYLQSAKNSLSKLLKQRDLSEKNNLTCNHSILILKASMTHLKI